jgi:AAA domain
MQTLDLWLHQIDTEERLPLFIKEAREYAVPGLTAVNWSEEPDHLVRIAKHQDFAAFLDFRSESQFASVFHWLLDKGESTVLHRAFDYLVKSIDKQCVWFDLPAMIVTMVDLLTFAPYLAIHFSHIVDWDTLPTHSRDVLRQSAQSILRAIVVSANQMQELAVLPFKKVLSQTHHIPMSSFFDLVELIALTVRSPEVALDLLLECLEPQTSRILTERPAVVELAVRSGIGIALDHIDEASQSKSHRSGLLDLKFADANSRSFVLECRLRLDAPSSGALAQGDHVQLTAASSPQNSLIANCYSIDAQVLLYEPGFAKFQCLHPPPRFVQECSWLLDNCGSFVTSKTMLTAVNTFATQLGECCRVYRPILGVASSGLDVLSSTFTPREDLNDSQNKAIQFSLSFPLTCLWGPPGTGKTHTIVALLRELLISEPEQRILVSAPTHNAVDNVMRKYLSEVRGARDYDPPLRVSTDVSLQDVLDILPAGTCFAYQFD